MDPNRFIPYKKLSKRQQKDVDRQKRRVWNTLNPVTRCPERPDAYNRKTENRRWKDEARGHDPNSSGGFTNYQKSLTCPLFEIL